jgi:transketolase C-terminal domain/subunit
MAMHGCMSHPFRSAREQLEFLWSRARPEDGRPDHPDGRHLDGEHPPVWFARRRRDRCRRTVTDGPGGPGHDAGCARLTGVVPSDATSAAFLVQEMTDRQRIVYLRTTRGAYPVLYPADEVFPIGGAKVVSSGADDQVALIGAGVTRHNCLAPADLLAGEGIRAPVIDLCSLKPIDTETLLAASVATGDRLAVVEDHHPEGGIGAAMLQALSSPGHPAALAHLAVRELPGSGSPQELMDATGISAGPIADAARRIV